MSQLKSLSNLPQRDWAKKLEVEFTYKDRNLKIYSVEPQAHLIGVTQPVGMLEGYSADALLVKAFEKNYKTPSKPKVVETYGFEQMHSEPIEMISFNYECIFDRAIAQQMNRYRHNSKNYESGRYVDYIKHGLTFIFPDHCKTQHSKEQFVERVMIHSFMNYVDALQEGAKKQSARRCLPEAVAIESEFAINLRSLWHMARQRSQELSPNGREAEPQIGNVMTQAVKQVEKYLPHFYDALLRQIEKGYR